MVIALKPYSKVGLYGTTKTRVLILLEDNSLWWYADGDDWKKVKQDGLPEGQEIKVIRSYQKYNMMGSTETRYIVLMADNSVWWFAAGGKKWKKFKGENYPASKDIELMEVYMKFKVMGMPEGRIVAVLSDQSIWWAPAKEQNWKKLNAKGLPDGYKIKSLKVYQKSSGLSQSSRLLVLLEDNTIWWYVNGEAFSPVDMKGLGEK